MRILGHHNKTPNNNLVKAIQEHCRALLIAPHEHGIFQLEDLNQQLETFIYEISPQYPRCKAESLKGEVHSYLAFEVYNLLYNDEIPLISITSRKTEYEESFRDHDDSRYSGALEPNRYHYNG
jgi:hypothetical protein